MNLTCSELALWTETHAFEPGPDALSDQLRARIAHNSPLKPVYACFKWRRYNDVEQVEAVDYAGDYAGRLTAPVCLVDYSYYFNQE